VDILKPYLEGKEDSFSSLSSLKRKERRLMRSPFLSAWTHFSISEPMDTSS